MVQREVADRFFAIPSTKAYGVGLRAGPARRAAEPGSIPSRARCFALLPNVDSALVAFRRIPLPADFAGVRRVVEGAFAHRRKTLANSLQLAGVATREAAVGRTRRPRARPVRSGRGARPAGVRRAGAVARMRRLAAPAKINLALVVGPLRARRQARGRHGPAAHRSRTIASRVSAGRAPHRHGLRRRHDRRGGPRGARGRRRCRARLDAWRSRRRSLSRPGSAAAAPTRPPRSCSRTSCSREPLEPERLAELAATIGADVPFFLATGPQLGTGDGTILAPLDLPQDFWVVLVLPAGTVKTSTGRRVRRLRRAGRRRRLRRAPGGAPRRARRRPQRPRPRTASRRTTSRRHRCRSGSAAAGAFRADVSGAGPCVYGLFADRRRAEARQPGAAAGTGRTWVTSPL